MNRQTRHRILAATALAALLAGGAATASPIKRQDEDRAQQVRQEHRQERKEQRKDRQADRREAFQQRRDAVQQDRRDVFRQQQAVPQQQRVVVQQQRDMAQQHRHFVQDRREDRRDDRREAVQDRRDDRRDWRQDRREDRQDWRQDRRDDRRDARRDAQRDAQRRIAYMRYRQDYDRRMRSFHVTYAPRYYVRPAHYRYFWGGTWYTTSNYGADVLRQAVDWGYREGVRAGRADRYDGWPADYRDSVAWRNGGFGYGGRYVSRADYGYYFRQGFQRGYDDGYFGRMEYGRYVDNNAVIAEAVIATILGLQLLR